MFCEHESEALTCKKESKWFKLFLLFTHCYLFCISENEISIYTLSARHCATPCCFYSVLFSCDFSREEKKNVYTDFGILVVIVFCKHFRFQKVS